MQEPQIVSKPGFTTVGMKIRTSHQDDLPQLWDRFNSRMGEIKHIQQPIVGYGLLGNYDQGSGEFDYLAAFGVTEAADLPAGMESRNVPAQTYAVFPCTLSTLRAKYDAIYREWLPASTYEHAYGPEFELYDQDFDTADADPKLYIYIPIKPR